MIILFAIWFNLLASDHAIYISVIEVRKQENITEIKVKVFQDDLQNAVKNNSGAVMLTAPGLFPQKYPTEIESYFIKHLKVNDLTYRLVNYELRGDSYWFTFQAESSDWTILSITADYFIELFPTQENILRVSHKGEKRFCRMNSKERSCTISF